jgi:iron complex outermembrane receptor protein
MIRLVNRVLPWPFSSILAVSASFAAPAFAADAGTADSKESGGLQEIVVTAQRRSESQERTPVAVTVVSSDALVEQNVVSEQDLRFATPGLTVRAGLSSNQLNYSLRGQSQDAFSGTRPGVLPYVNEVQISGAGGSTAFYDLQSVQVLKGPQGTLFGRSATGGAVLFTTTKPTDTLSGYINGAAGDYSDKRFEGAISGPLIGESLLGRVSAFYQDRDGYQYNLFNNQRTGGLKREGVRGSLTVSFGPDFRNELVVDYLHDDSQSMVGPVAGLLPFTGGGPGNPPLFPLSYLYAGTATPLATATGIGTLQALLPPAVGGLAPAFYTNYFAQPGHAPQGITAFIAEQQARGPFLIDTDGTNAYRANNFLLTNTTTFDLSAATQIKNIVGYVNSRTLNSFDGDGTPYGIANTGLAGSNTGFIINPKAVSEELQLLGKAAAGRLAYASGLYYSDEKVTQLEHSEFFDLILGGQTQHNDVELERRTYAGYAQGTYDLNDNGLAFTLGARQTIEKASKITLPTDVNYPLAVANPSMYSIDESKTFRQLSWQVGLQDQLSKTTLLYIVSRRAFKAGGYNSNVPPSGGTADVAGDAYKEERVTDVEGGLKFQGRLAEMPTRVNVALFNNWVVNGQRTAFSLVGPNPASLTVNVPQGRTYGAEFEAQIKPIDWLELGTTFNYTHATFVSGGNQVNANGSVQTFDRVPDTPKTSGTVYAEITVPVLDTMNIALRGATYYQSESYTSPRSQNFAGTTMPSYAVTDFRLTLQSTRHGWSLALNLKNAFNRVYYVGGLPTGEIYQLNSLVPGAPRTIIGEARWTF